MSQKKPTTLRKKMSYERRKSLYGYGFISLWIVGFLLFFLRPFVSVIVYSLSKIEYLDNGHRIVFRGLANYKRALLEDPDIVPMMVDSIKDIPVTVITIVIVSLAIAVVLNRKFMGRTVVRAVFFVPVIVASGIVISILNGDAMAATMMAGQKSSAMLQVSGLTEIMMQMGLPEQLINTVTGRLNSDKVLFSFARGRERCDRNGHAVFLRPGVDFATTGSEITGISTSSTKLK